MKPMTPYKETEPSVHITELSVLQRDVHIIEVYVIEVLVVENIRSLASLDPQHRP